MQRESAADIYAVASHSKFDLVLLLEAAAFVAGSKVKGVLQTTCDTAHGLYLGDVKVQLSGFEGNFDQLAAP
jgi:hypothetical protein